MALTQVKTAAIADDAVTTDKLANAINTERTANTAKVSLEDNSVTLAKMAAGTDGQIITYDASGDPVAVGPGTDGQVLTSTGAGSPPAFEDAASGATLSGSTDDTVVTVTGANAMTGESSLKFTSNYLHLNHANGGISWGTGTPGSFGTSPSIGIAEQAGYHSTGSAVDDLVIGAKYQKAVIIGTSSGTSGGLTTRFSVENDGDVQVKTGNLVIGTSGKGIDFSATSDGGTDTPVELLDDYEEGIWAPAPGIGTCTVAHASYTKIGDIVTGFFQVSGFSNTSASNGVTLSTPFAAQNTKNGSTGFNTTVGAATGKHIHSDAQSLTPSLTMNAGGSSFTFGITSDTESWDTVRHQDLESNHVLQGFFTYKVA